MAATSARTLRLLSLLQIHRFWPGPELAGRLEVSERTLRRDIERLRELGYPVRSTRGTDGGYQLENGAAMPPLLVDADETVAIVLALRNATSGAAAGLSEASLRALAKVMQVLPRPLRRRAEALEQMTQARAWDPPPELAADVLTTLALACRDQVRVELEHRRGDVDPVRRRVEPLRLVPQGRRWYLVGYDLLRHDWRCYRVDRISAVSPTREAFAPRRLPAADAAEFVAVSTSGSHAGERVVAEVETGEAHARAWIGRWAEVEPLGEQRCRVTMQTDEPHWALHALNSLDADFTVLAPDSFRAEVARRAERMLRAAGVAAGGGATD
ncbi:WYL domain-containing protein [Auraticoccus sp. F435]|uniref:WYL domain-containing protein n=1 Tax=Auraticoccus cholistanensis TaxID=2656650 RepID=A0A6A9V035_9ACTN|nr:YafY family protein [Auraticoccus cholistanensis]MVA74909.1 WYL domain-containing protein [Auraticoccus cholistanensis]